MKKLILILLLSFSLQSIGQGNFFWSHNEVPIIAPCGEGQVYPGGAAYPTAINITTGPISGFMNFYFSASTVPDRFIVYDGSTIIYDSGYRGYDVNYTYGGVWRSDIIDNLIGKIDPTTGVVYPYTGIMPEGIAPDGYPYVYPDITSVTIEKTTTNPATTVKVYSPIGGTYWQFELSCPTH